MSCESFAHAGFTTFEGLLEPTTCDAIARRIRSYSNSRGTRNVLTRSWCRALVNRLRQSEAVSALLPADYIAIQCTYFEKSREHNWLVAPHQDLSVPVAERIEHQKLSGWSHKEDMLFVQPPVELLERLVAVRLHLDDCDLSDGPLKLWPGSHRHGRLATTELQSASRNALPRTSRARAGDVLVMRPLLVHASSKSSGDGRRRVLHFVFGPREPGYGLRWPGSH